MDERIANLHRRIDTEAVPLAETHREALQCRRGCHDCCRDGLTVFEAEADEIRRHHGSLLKDGRPHPPGKCAFLDGEGACRIYAQRPYVCRTQGLPLRWLAEDDAGEIVEQRDICPLNEVALESLAETDCWTIGPVEFELQQIQGDDTRVPLRSLFAASDDDV